MIRNLNITDPDSTLIPWLGKVKAFELPRRFDFSPGLNILWGPNGTGKSTVLRLLAKLFHCEQSGSPYLTETSFRNFYDRWRFRETGWRKLPEAVQIDHDGQGVQFFDPTDTVGLIGGMAGFDYDFIGEAVSNLHFKGSAGQTTMRRFEGVLSRLISRDVPEMNRKLQRWPKADPEWLAQYDLIETFLKGSGPKGPATVLLDEPDRSLDLRTQVMIWRALRSFSREFQFIVATHSIFALNIPEATYHELEPGTMASANRCLGLLSGWKDEVLRDPPPPPPKKAPEPEQPPKPTKKPRAKRKTS